MSSFDLFCLCLKRIKWMTLTSTIDLAQVWKSPNIPKSHSKTDAREQILTLIIPFGSFGGVFAFPIRSFNCQFLLVIHHVSSHVALLYPITKRCIYDKPMVVIVIWGREGEELELLLNPQDQRDSMSGSCIWLRACVKLNSGTKIMSQFSAACAAIFATHVTDRAQLIVGQVQINSAAFNLALA